MTEDREDLLYCGCESSFCDHHNPVQFDASGKPVGVYPASGCEATPSGNVTMDWVGDVCDFCAFNIEASGGAGYIHRTGRTEADASADMLALHDTHRRNMELPE